MTMRALTILPLLLLCLAGCAGNRAAGVTAYGNLLTVPVPAQESGIAADAAARLVASYPPAHTRFTLQHAAQDGFGAELLGQLRARGYAIGEFTAPEASNSPLPSSPSVGATPLRYVLDLAREPDLVRLTLYTGGESLTRAYLIQGDAARPASAWIHREAGP